MPVVVVESPAKARTIEKYLGKGYRVLASFGHVRDLVERNGSVDTGHEFGMKWEVPTKSKKHLKAISDAVARDGDLILATDPDREGEAISWHIKEILNTQRRVAGSVQNAKRVVFNAITKSAVLSAMENPRDVDMQLVDAYLARRALDYLVGYTLSPVVMRKLPGARSAGRVQSVCVRLIVERETEIETFKPREFWTVDVTLDTSAQQGFTARLVSVGEKSLGKFGLASQADVDKAVAIIESCAFSVGDVTVKPTMQNPYPPFMTSTLQQEASRKLGFAPRWTMSTAQKLYEAGLITYMRTDGIEMAPEAIGEARHLIGKRFGTAYVPSRKRVYKNKAKNAQEAHECIRPTAFANTPDSLPGVSPEQRKLYQLIWRRAMASQMASARFMQTSIEIAGTAGQDSVGLRAVGRVPEFDGFLVVYDESRDDAPGDEEQDETAPLPSMAVGDGLTRRTVEPKQHFTKAPPRYTEASLVKKMVDYGIGRPSTYSSLVATIQDRGYVGKEKSRLYPLAIGRVVTLFLQRHFSQYVEYGFTAALEEELDEVSNGTKSRLDVLSGFWGDFAQSAKDATALRNADVFEEISDGLASLCFVERDDGRDPRSCPQCETGQLYARTAPGGSAFIGCSNYPDCRYTRNIDGSGGEAENQDVMLGNDPQTGSQIWVKSGRYGPYVEREAARTGDEKPRRTSIPKGIEPTTVTLQLALDLLALPRELGQHPDDRKPIEAGIGRYGPFVRHGRTYAKLAHAEEALTIGMNRAMELLANRRLATGTALKELGEHPTKGGPMTVLNGRYGPYVKWGRVNISLPKGVDAETITAEKAAELLASKRSAKGSVGGSLLGDHPNKGGEIRLLSGRYGPYVTWNKVNASLPKGTDPGALTLADAADLIDAKDGA